jgi:hypothetical protein
VAAVRRERHPDRLRRESRCRPITRRIDHFARRPEVKSAHRASVLTGNRTIPLLLGACPEERS